MSVPSPYSSASAPRSRRRSTRFGTIAETTTFSRETNAASRAASAYNTPIAGSYRGRRRQRRRRQHEAHLVEEQQLAPVDPVGDGAAQERGGDERRQLDGSEEPDQQRRSRLDVHLVGQRD